MSTRLGSALLFLVVAAFGQRRIEPTVKIGIPLTDAFESGSYQFLATGRHEGHSATRRYTAGAGIELRVWRSLGAEADIIYHRLGYELTSSTPAIPVIAEQTRTTANSWEFPLIGVYRPVSTLRFLGGVSLRTTTGETTVGQCVPAGPQYASLCASTASRRLPSEGRAGARAPLGGTVGVEVGTRLGRVRLLPGVRYTRWRADAGAGSAPFDLRSNTNDVEVLVSIGYSGR